MGRFNAEVERIKTEIKTPIMDQMYQSIVQSIHKKKILITGATGMLGSQLCYTILALNQIYSCSVHVIALARDYSKVKGVFKDVLNNKNLSFVYFDILEPLKIESKIDYIIHTAGVTGGSKQHIENPMRTISTAIDGIINVLNLGREKNVKHIIYISSLEVYGDTDHNLNSIKEDDMGFLDCTKVRSCYPESKRMCECICSSYYKQYGVPTSIARLTATFGPGVRYQDGRVFAQFARSVIESKDIVLHSLGDTVRNYCDVSDAANACLLLLSKGEISEAYNVANMNTAVSIKELAEVFIKNAGDHSISLKIEIPDDIKDLGYRDTVKIRLDSTKLKNLGWHPYYDINEMVSRLIKGMRVNGN